jgi:prolyl-tRNA synthetase
VQEIDLQSLATAPAAVAPTSKAPVKEKEDAKIEGAVQIAIGVKKDVDFAAWYTNVNCRYLTFFFIKTFSEFLAFKVLIKADMIDYYSVSGCYILKPWSYSIWEVIQGRWEQYSITNNLILYLYPSLVRPRD